MFDFGGVTHDVTLVNIRGKKSDVITTAGDCNLGGQDIDNALVDFIVMKSKE